MTAENKFKSWQLNTVGKAEPWNRKSKFHLLPAGRPMYKLILLTKCKLILSSEPKLDSCLAAKVLLNRRRFLPSDTHTSGLPWSNLWNSDTFDIRFIPNTYLQSVYVRSVVHYSKWVNMKQSWCNSTAPKKLAKIYSEPGDTQAHQRTDDRQRRSLGFPKRLGQNIYSGSHGSESLCSQN